MSARTCSIDGCCGQAQAGWCSKHWPARFWSKVDEQGAIPGHRPDLGPCWVWRGRRDAEGYGRFDLDRRERLAHRIGYELLGGPIPDGLELDHLCRVTSCVRVDHLEAVAHQVNARRGNAGLHGRSKTHCPSGHPYDESNTWWNRPKGRGLERRCKTCRRQLRNRQRARVRATRDVARKVVEVIPNPERDPEALS